MESKVITVKTSFSSIIREEHKAVFEDAISRVNNIIFETYLFIKLFVIDLYHRGKELPPLDKDFITAVMSTVSTRDNRGKIKKYLWLDRIKKFYDTSYAKHRDNRPKPVGTSVRQILQLTAVSLVTSYKNNITMHFFRHLFKFIKMSFFDKDKMNKSTKEERKIHYREMNQVYNDIINLRNPEDYKSLEKYHAWINKNKLLIIPHNINDIEKELEVNPLKFLKSLIYMNIELDKINKKNDRDFDYLYWLKLFIRSEFYNKEQIKNLSVEEKKQLRKDMRRIGRDIFKERDYISPNKYHEWIDKHFYRVSPGLLDSNKKLRTELKHNPIIFKEQIAYIQTMLLNKNIGKKSYQIKLFQPLPIKTSLIPTYVQFDTLSLMEIFKERNKTKSNNILKYERTTWNKYFKLNNKAFKGNKKYVFKGTIYTDGIGCSILKIIKKLKGKKFMNDKWKKPIVDYLVDLPNNKIEQLKNKKIVGVDPGRKDILYLSSRDDNGKIEKMRYSYNQRRIECKYKESFNKRIKFEKKNPAIKKPQKIMKELNCKTCDYSEFILYIRWKFEYMNIMKPHYENKIYRNLRWNSYINKQKSEDKMVNNIIKKFGRNIVLILGDWSPIKQMRGHASTPNKGLIRKIKKRLEIYFFDEYKTTKICNICKSNHETEYHIKSRENPNPKKSNKIPVHGLLVCKNVNCGKLLTRDLNGSTNVGDEAIYFMEYRKRREVFRRN